MKININVKSYKGKIKYYDIESISEFLSKIKGSIRVEANEEEFLGHINTFYSEDLYKRKILMKVKNPHHYQFYNVSIEVGPYKDFKDYSKYVGLSLDEDGEFSQEIDLGIVNPFSEEYFWLELSRATEVDIGINEVYFSLKVNSNVDL